MLRACKRLSIVLNFGVCSTFTYLLNLISTFLFSLRLFFFVVKLKANSKSWNMSGFACLWYGDSSFLTDFAMFCLLWKLIFNNSYLVVVDASVFSSLIFRRRFAMLTNPKITFQFAFGRRSDYTAFQSWHCKTVYISIYICLALDFGPLVDFFMEKRPFHGFKWLVRLRRAISATRAEIVTVYLDYVLQSALIWNFCASVAIFTTPITTRTQQCDLLRFSHYEIEYCIRGTKNRRMKWRRKTTNLANVDKLQRTSQKKIRNEWMTKEHLCQSETHEHIHHTNPCTSSATWFPN